MYRYLFLLLPFFISCQEKDINSIEYYNVPHSNLQANDLNKTLNLTNVKLSDDIEFSGAGEFWINNDTLCLTDAYFNYVFWLDSKGKVVKKQVGKGRGPNEILDCNASLPGKIDFALYNAGNWSLNLFSNDGVKKKKVQLDFFVDKQISLQMLKEPDAKSSSCYEIEYKGDVLKPWDEDHIAIALLDYLPSFNGYMNSEYFYKQSRILSIVDRNTGKIERIFGRRSPVYLEKKNIPNFNHLSFTVLDECVYVSFFADHKIYVLDKNEDKAICSFGCEGREMNVNYRQTKSFEEAEANWGSDYETFGYYRNLHYDPKLDLLFRTYRKGSHKAHDGLQIYRDKKLLADIDVPQSFTIVGVANSQLYATVEEGDENLKLFTVQIHNLIQ